MKRALIGLLVVAFGCQEEVPPDGTPKPGPPASGPQGSSAPPSTPASLPPSGPVDRKKLPTPVEAAAWAPPAVEQWVLPNGLAVYYLRQDHVPLVSIELILPVGSSSDPPGKAGLASLTADMLDEGAGDLDTLALGDALQRLATDYGAVVGTDATTLSMNLLADKLEPSLDLLRKLVRSPTFPKAEFERRKALRLASALASEKEPAAARGVVLRRVLFGQGYGGNTADGVRATLQKLTLADVQTFYGQAYAPKGAKLVVVGAVERNTIEPALTAAFGDWNGEPTLAPAAVAPAVPAPGIHLIDFPGATQSAVAVARRIDGIAAADYFDAIVFNWALGGSFASRLNLNLREAKGYTYGASTTFNRWKKAGFFAAAAMVKAQETAPSITEILKELAEVASARPVTEEERDSALGGLLRGFPSEWENQGAVAGRVAELALYERPLDWFARWPDSVRATTLAGAQKVAQSGADAGQYIIVVAGDRKLLTPSLSKLGLPIKLYDAQGASL